MDPKSFLQSKTFWLNALALVVALVQTFAGPLPVVDTQQFAVAMAAVNIVLRLITKAPVRF